MLDGKVYDQEDLEPPLLPSSKFLTEGASYREAMALLDAFLKDRAAVRIEDPLKRALFQRDLWAVFATLSGAARQTYREGLMGRLELAGIEDLGDTDLPQRTQRREVQLRLAQIMRQVALAPAEIDALPDNLAAAVRADSKSAARIRTSSCFMVTMVVANKIPVPCSVVSTTQTRRPHENYDATPRG